ncbi:CheR family methyltransferase [Pseudooceanicola sp. MF1-13]|uniref:CheR family methyltransferase n=1 Tax=Pseudooceanicola sp. MF1-13 TaxID=3379095 RepID=UPI0038916811
MQDSDQTPKTVAEEGTFPLVALGASAGGLKPLEDFFNSAPVNEGWSFVVIQHLSPDYSSMMKSILERQSHLRIQHVQDGLTIEPNTIYLNRPSEFFRLEGGEFRTRAYDIADGLPHLPIDYFFNSLCGRDPARTFAIILSGSGSDGARGATALHAAGATVMVQSPESAEFSSMPQNALKTGCVDRIVAPREMSDAIRDTLINGRPTVQSDTITASRISLEIQDLLKQQTNVDFGAYKPDLVLRRIERRQQLSGFKQLEEYLQLLKSNPAALDELYQDILIGVTQFYRNPDAIAALRREVIDKIVAEKTEGDPIRIWVPACASGEEAYTIAIEMNESILAAGSNCNFRVIATDVHRRSIDRASTGVYGHEALEHMPVAIRDKYFDKHRDQYIVDPGLRQKIIFSVHDALSDPPFMHLDLVSCRNFLIYLEPEPRRRILSMFLFGLRKGGYLMLGPSETVGAMSDDFENVNQRWRLYRKSSQSPNLRRYYLPDLPRAPKIPEKYIAHTERPAFPDGRNVESIELRNRDMLIKSYNALLRRYAPSSILITLDGRVLSWFGAASAFVDTMNNLADWTVEDIVHPSLHFAINVGIEKLRQKASEPYSRRVTVESDDEKPQICDVTIEALEQSKPPRFLLVSLKLAENGSDETPKPMELLAPDEDGAILALRNTELERDLRLTEETLQQVTERLEASGEELQASNEELQASNEELQASNEELQSSNEELHAVNEELVTVSAEHELKIEQLQDLNRSMDMVLRMLNVGVIILDQQGHIRRFSQLIGAMFQMQQHDINRTLDVVGPRFDFADLKKMSDKTLADGSTQRATGPYAGHNLTIETYSISHADSEGADNGVVMIFRGFNLDD